MKEVLLLFVCLMGMGTFSADAQQENVDSLETLINKEKGDTDTKVALLLAVAKIYETTSPQQALKKAEQALDITISNKKKHHQVEALNILGAITIKLGDFTTARQYFEKALKLSEQEQIHIEKSIALNGLGTIASYSQNFDLAKSYFESNLLFCDSLGLVKEKNKSLTNLSHIYQNLGKMEKALKLQKEALIIIDEYDLGKLSKAKSLLGIANIFGRSEQNDSALVYLKQSLPIFKAINDQFGIAIAYASQGNVARNKGALQLAVSSFDSARLYYQLIGNEQEVAISSVQAGEVLNIMGYPEKAVTYIESALSIIKKGNNKRALLFAYQNYAGALSELIRINANKNVALIRDSIIHIYNTTVQIANELGDTRSEGLAYSNLGLTYSKAGNCDKAIPILLKGIKIRSTNQFDKELYNPYLTLSNCYINKGKMQEAFKHLKIADSIAVANVETTNTGEFYLELAKAYKEVNAFEKSNDALFLYIDMRKQYYDENKALTIAELEEKYQTRQKEFEIQSLEKENELQLAVNRNQRFLLITGLLILSALVYITYLSYKRSQERKRSNQLLTDKNEKIGLLHKELKHRVKNNMAFVSSLMRMQARRLQSEEAKLAIKEGEARIEAMSLLHRKLYLQDTVEVEANTYLKELCTYLQHSFPSQNQTPAIDISADQLMINGEDAMRLGLIINELVTNSFKYAFSDVAQPKIDISLSSGTNGSYQLLYKDNGKGLPSELEIAQQNSLGLKLIYTLTQQLDGELSQYNDGGACFRLDFERPQIAV